MELKAESGIQGTLMVDIKDIYWELDDAAKLDRNFRESLRKSLDEKGMVNPIIITSRKNFNNWLLNNPHRGYWTKAWDCKEPYRCWLGNNRLDWAVSKGYTSIECFIVENKEQLDAQQHVINMDYGVDF